MRDEDERERTPAGNLRPPNRNYVLQWIAEAWGKISTETIKQSFLVTGISSALNGSQDAKMFSHIPEVMASIQQMQEQAAQDAAQDMDPFEDGDGEVDDIDPFDE
jgi:hypothetical protein